MENKRAIIIGATSGIGQETARQLLEEGWTIGIAGRRNDRLQEFKAKSPNKIFTQEIDIRKEDAAEQLKKLIEKLGGMDLYLHCSGIGKQNMQLNSEIEINTLETNGTGFVRMITAAYNYFKTRGRGHIAVVSSIAGTKGLGTAPSYSATKRFQNTYIDALEQLAHMQKTDITFTDIRPGFVATDLLNDGKSYPMLMRTEDVARHIIHAINHKKRIATIDWKYRLLVAFWRLIPRCVWKQMPVHN